MARDALHHSGNPWQPFYKFKYKSGQYDYQEVPRKFRSILNKVTSKNFLTLVEQANSLHVNTEDKLNGVVDLIHEKAIHEPNFSSIYAKLSSRLAQLSVPSSEQPGKEVNFRKLLLAKCQLEFESKFNKRKESLKAFDSTGDENHAEKMKKKSRYQQLGNVIFIGELFKVNMVAESIIHHCIKRLLIERSEESLECFCGLLRTVGKYLEIAISRRSIQNNNVMDFYIYEVQKVIDAGFLSSRMRFMLEDLIELRANDWFPLRICNFFGPISHVCIEECNFQDNNSERIRKHMESLLSNEMKEKIAHLVEQVSNSDYEEATKYVTELANAYSAFMFVNLAVFQVIERSSQARHLLGRFFCLMVKNKILCLEEYCLGFSSILKSVDEYSLDIPFLKEYIGEILVPMIEDSKLPLTFLKEILVPCIPSQTSGEIVAAVLLLASKQKGKIRIAELWKASGLQWADFLHSNSEKEFIENHKIEFLMAPVETISNTEISGEEFKQLAKGLLKEVEDNGEIFDFIDANLSKNGIFEPSIIRALVLAVHEDTISVLNADFKLNQVQYEKRIAILSRYIHNNKNLELETLNTIHYFISRLNISSMLQTEVLHKLFDILCHSDVISEDVIETWKETIDPNELEC